MSRIIVHADDFGEAEHVTSGIIKAIEGGIVRSTSVMANMVGTEHAIQLMPLYAEGVSFGVHLNFCEGQSLTLAPSLTDKNGEFMAKRVLALRSLLGRLNKDELRSEIDAQIETVKKSGVPISHLDGHKHLHQLPHIFEATVLAAKRHNITGIRICEQHPFRLQTNLKAGTSRVFRQLFAKRIMRCESFAGRQSILKGNYDVTELFCHPGVEGPKSDATGSCNRSGELQYLLSEDFAQLLSSLKLTVTNYWEM
jgi:predicted glycoside hydrolase/deacetylase ChbG (UPF0249 family)